MCMHSCPTITWKTFSYLNYFIFWWECTCNCYCAGWRMVCVRCSFGRNGRQAATIRFRQRERERETRRWKQAYRGSQSVGAELHRRDEFKFSWRVIHFPPLHALGKEDERKKRKANHNTRSPDVSDAQTRTQSILCLVHIYHNIKHCFLLISFFFFLFFTPNGKSLPDECCERGVGCGHFTDMHLHTNTRARHPPTETKDHRRQPDGCRPCIGATNESVYFVSSTLHLNGQR